MERTYYIGMDDTDNEESRGTGFLSRRMAGEIAALGLGSPEGVTRHQLLVDPRIPYTSQNSSACIVVRSRMPEALKERCRSTLLRSAAPGSDAGLCFAPAESIGREVLRWGARAKKEVLTMEEAVNISRDHGISLEGLTGSKTGMIGALAAAGLRKSGNDGRFIWLHGQKELRDILPGYYMVEELIRIYNFDVVMNRQGDLLDNRERVWLGDWVRPLLKDNKVTLLVDNGLQHDWEIASKNHIRSIS